MQNVAWPTTIVAVEKLIPARPDGGVQGEAGDDARQGDRQDQRQREDLPAEETEPMDGEGRERPEDDREQRRAGAPTWSDRPSASRTDGLSHAEPNHWVLNSRIGQTWIRCALNA